MKAYYILSESVYDYKYKSIFDDIDNIVVIEKGFLGLLKFMILHPNKCCYHIRYIRYKGLANTMMRLVLIYIVSRLSLNKILWSCHNVYEHNIEKKEHNNIIRGFMLLISSRVIVFHSSIKSKLPLRYHNKVEVANFGDFREFVNQKKEINLDFSTRLLGWSEGRGGDDFNILSVSTAKKSRIDVLMDGLVDSKLRGLIIAPGVKFPHWKDKDNIFLYTDAPVYVEVAQILNSNVNFVGFIGHCNYSVATSLYMFASFGIPIISFDAEPVSSLVSDNNLGVVIKNSEELEGAYMKIQSNYLEYSNNTAKFISFNSWERSRLIHSNLIKSIFNKA